MLVTLPPSPPLTWSPARPEDGPALAELRATVLRPSLERLGRYDDVRVRERFLSGFAPERTQVLRGPAGPVGSLALRPAPDGVWLEHFYLDVPVQGRGVGTAALSAVTRAADASGTTVRLDVLQRSDARRLYERHGFVLDHEDPVDVFLVRAPRP
ncbi:GNAT family N-acetyltransferase [Kineococcus rhizosphaerae]|uniref:GNAT family N-acetyltransferase n=1 Tax=Kineococcus rhizosphaerae TaxID=559628 RepID=UPI001B8049DD|nr:GNAT family N-acetyltransferase [Kineococcus rhizosphaerae]